MMLMYSGQDYGNLCNNRKWEDPEYTLRHKYITWNLFAGELNNGLTKRRNGPSVFLFPV